MSTPPPVSSGPVIAYATPEGLRTDRDAVFVEGPLIVGPTTIDLPHRCVKCNGQEAKRFTRKLWWHHPAFALMIIFPGLIFYALVAFIVRKGGTVHFGLCDQHRRRRGRLISLAWLTALLGLVAIVGGAIASDTRSIDRDLVPFIIIGGVLLLIGSLIVGLVGSKTLTPARIDHVTMKLKGAGPEFLRNLEATEPVAVAQPVR